MIYDLRLPMCIKTKISNHIFKLLILLPLGLVFATVFAQCDAMAMGVVSAKTYWFYGAMGICGVTTIVFLALRNQFKIRFSFAEILLVLFAVLGLLPYIIGTEVVGTKAVVLALLVVLYFYFRVALQAFKLSAYFFTILLLISALVQAVWGMAQLYGYLPSQHNMFALTGSFFNPGPYAGYLAMLSPLALYYVLSDYRVFQNSFAAKLSFFYLRWAVAALTLLAIVLVLPATMSRAAWLASASACVWVGFAFLASKFKLQAYIVRYKKALAVAIVLVVLLLSAGGFAMYQMKKDSADGRALIWKNTLNAIQDNPWGVGLGHFAGAYGKVQAAYFENGMGTAQEEKVAGNPEYAFNEYLQIGLEFGIAGLLLFVVAVILLLKKGMHEQKYGAVGAVVSLLVFAAMSYPFSILAFLIVMVYLLAYLSAEAKLTNKKLLKGSFLIPKTMVYVILILNSCLLAIGLYKLYPTYRAYTDWNNAKMLYHMQYYAEVLPQYTSLAPHLNDRVEFLFEYAQILSKTAHYQQSNEVLAKATSISCDPMLYNVMGRNYQALKNYKAAEQNFAMASNIVPSRMYPYYLLAKLYYETGDRHKFEQAAALVLQKEPKIHSPAINEMRDEIKKLVLQHSPP